MTFYLVPDETWRSPRWMVLAGGRRVLRDQLQAAYSRMCGESASQFADGYLTRDQAVQACDVAPKHLELLCRPVLGLPPLVHRPGDTCGERNCIDQSPPWVQGFELRICSFLRRNPSKKEYARDRGHKADARNYGLQRMVWERDGGCCRYCRSGPMTYRGSSKITDRRFVLQYEHPDPEDLAHPDGGNFVVACARCNQYKARRTTKAAGMRLLPVPTDEQRAEWLRIAQLPREQKKEREQLRRAFDPEDWAHLPEVHDANDRADQGTATTDTHKQHTSATHKQRTHVMHKQRRHVSVACSDASSTGDVRPETAGQPHTQAADMSPEVSPSGRVGQRVVGAVEGAHGQPVRYSDSPDIYTGHVRGPTSPAHGGGDP